MSSADTERAAGPLYTIEMLALSAELALYPMEGRFEHRAEARSKTCGSTLAIGLDMGPDQRVTRIGLQVSACAVGQSSAAILAGGITNKSLAELADTRHAIEAWLAGSGELPDWPRLDAIIGARTHKGRHGALILPWKAAIDALSSPATVR